MQKTDLATIYLCGIIGMLALGVHDKVSRGIFIRDIFFIQNLFPKRSATSAKGPTDFIVPVPVYEDIRRNKKQQENAHDNLNNFLCKKRKKIWKNQLLNKRKGISVQSLNGRY